MGPSRFRVIGPGRAGLSLSGALEQVGWQAEPPLRRGDDVRRAAQGVDLLVIATPDAAIADVAARVDPVDTTVVVHLAGSLGLEPLIGHDLAAALHPLVSLPDASVGAARLGAGAWFAVAGDPRARSIVDQLGGHSFEIADWDRTLYHAAACIASNHLVALMGQVERVAESVGVPLAAYLEMARATLENVIALGPRAALDGSGRSRRRRHDRPAPRSPRRQRTAGVLSADGTGPSPGPEPLVIATTLMTTIAEVRDVLETARQSGLTVGLVPTMGYLHEGHASLIERSVADNDLTTVTNFVNPLQFGPTEDLSRYPRDLAADLRLAGSCGADVMFAPPVDEMYATPIVTTVAVAGVSEPLEGLWRPGHFEGVATVVAKLFSIAGPCRAYFGEKDFQQLAVVRAMTRDLSIPVEVVGCPTVREPDGLARSSRNVYLDERQRAAAPVLHRALQAGVAALESGATDAAELRRVMRDVVATEPTVLLDYAEVVDPETFETPDALAGAVRLIIAARLGPTRLIDNAGAVAGG